MKKRKFMLILLLSASAAALLTGCGGNAADALPGDPPPATQTERANTMEPPEESVEPPSAAVETPLPVPESEPPAPVEEHPAVESVPPTEVTTQPVAESAPPVEANTQPVAESAPPAEVTAQPVEESAPAETPASDPAAEEIAAEVTQVENVKLEEESVALSEAPAAVPESVDAQPSGTQVKENADAVIDYSNLSDGYVMVQHKTAVTQRLKVQVKGPTTTYTYNLTAQQWEVFPLSDGNGAYQITVYRNATGNKYASVISLTTNVALKSEFSPFLHSNQYVDYDSAPNTVAKAAELLGNVSDPLKKVEIVYDYVVKGMTYDKELAATVKSGYLPVLDTVLKKMSGICFDYAALMTGMLRSQGVPCKLVVGYAGTAYHAWISVWVEGSGWVDGVIWFNGASWHRMDPTFASSGDSESILDYIGDGANYSAKYFY